MVESRLIKMTKPSLIPENLYKEIVSRLPICCIDVLVVFAGKFLLVKRKKIPFRNKWWLAGGRLFLGESFDAGLKRKLKEELGITKIKSRKFLGVGVTKYNSGQGYFGLPGHTVNLTFSAEINKDQAEKIILDTENHLSWRWFGKIPNEIDHYLKNLLKTN